MSDESFSTLLFRGIKNKIRGLFRFIGKILALCLTIIIVMGILTMAYEKTDNSNLSIITSGLDTEWMDYCYTNNTGDKKTLQKIENYISEQPAFVQEMFFEQNWKIVITKNLSTEFINSIDVLGFDKENSDFTKLKGLTIPEMKVIYLSNKNIKGEELYKNFLHEFGHFYDYINGLTSVSYKFNEIYKLNKYNNIYTEYEKSNSTEFFAASYALYKYSPSVLEGNVPNVYEYMEYLEGTITSMNVTPTKYIKFSFGGIMQMKLFILDLKDQVKDFTNIGV